MGVWTERLRLAKLGWKTTLRVNRNGIADREKLGVGFWAHTWHWHGRISEVNLHAHAVVDRDPSQLVEAFARLSGRVSEACDRAWREFPDSVPCQLPERLPDGRLALEKDSWSSRHFDLSQIRNFKPETLQVPTVETGLYASTVADLAMVAGTDFEDEINPYARPGYVGDEGPRSWQYAAYQRVFSRNDIRIKVNRQRIRTDVLDEAVVAAIADSGCRAILKRFDDYAPGGCRFGETPNGLPPEHEIWPPPANDAALEDKDATPSP